MSVGVAAFITLVPIGLVQSTPSDLYDLYLVVIALRMHLSPLIIMSYVMTCRFGIAASPEGRNFL